MKNDLLLKFFLLVFISFPPTFATRWFEDKGTSDAENTLHKAQNTLNALTHNPPGTTLTQEFQSLQNRLQQAQATSTRLSNTLAILNNVTGRPLETNSETAAQDVKNLVIPLRNQA